MTSPAPSPSFAQADAFLDSKEAKSAPMHTKIEFLRRKGLSMAAIYEAFRRQRERRTRVRPYPQEGAVYDELQRFEHAVAMGDVRTVRKTLADASEEGRSRLLASYAAAGQLMRHRSPREVSVLHVAAFNDLHEIVEVLCSYGADVDALSLPGEGVHYSDSLGGCSPLALACSNGCTESVRVLVNYHADLDATLGPHHETALSHSCKNLYVDIVALLVMGGLVVTHDELDKYHPLIRKAVERGTYWRKLRQETHQALYDLTTLPDVLIELCVQYII